MKLTRRDFIVLAGTTAAAAGASVFIFKDKLFGPPTPSPTPTPDRPGNASGTPIAEPGAFVVPTPPKRPIGTKRGIVVGPGRFLDEAGQPKFVLSVIDLDAATPAPKLTYIEFHAHGISPHPSDPTKAAVFEKQGAGACWVDLKHGKVIRPITTPEERYFYGHGAWTGDGTHVFATETILADKTGKMIVRDLANFEVRDEFPTYGESPHDCILVGNGEILAITNGGSATGATAALPSVTFVDVRTQKLIEKLEFDTPEINAGHLAISDDGDLVVVSAPRMGLDRSHKGGVSVKPAGRKSLATMTSPADLTANLKGEALSLSIHEGTGIVGVTHPDADCVTFWDVKKQAHVKTLPVPHPMGISQTLDRRHFMVSYGPTANLKLLDAETLADAGEIEMAFLTGSHFITHDFAG